MIDITNLSAGYGQQTVINNISLCIKEGEIVAIIGPNGSGKSTLLKCIARQIKHTSGSIAVAGSPVEGYSPKEFARVVSYLKQSRDIPAVTAEDLTLHGRYPYMGFPRKLTEWDIAIAKNAMKRVGVWELRHKELSALSGGECQKVYLAMTLTQDARVMLLDEPTTYLDIKHQFELLKLISELKADGKTVVTVLHDINSAVQISDKVCVMRGGEVAFYGSPFDLLKTNVISDVFGVKLSHIERQSACCDSVWQIIAMNTETILYVQQPQTKV